MKAHRKLSCLALTTLAVLAGAPALHASDDRNQDQKWNHPLPFGAIGRFNAASTCRIPFGVGLFLVTMSRDIEVYDVRVTLPGNEPTSISNVASFDVRNQTTLAALKLDAWILPLLNLYVLAGHTWTDTRLNAAVTIDRPIRRPRRPRRHAGLEGRRPASRRRRDGRGRLWPLVHHGRCELQLLRHRGVRGRYRGMVPFRAHGLVRPHLLGLVAGLDRGRLPCRRSHPHHDQESPILGTVKVEVDQRPVNPMTLQVGGSMGLSKRWELMVEVGSNFDDAFLAIFSASFRF